MIKSFNARSVLTMLLISSTAITATILTLIASTTPTSTTLGTINAYGQTFERTADVMSLDAAVV